MEIKRIPEDFVVKERATHQLSSIGRYGYFKLYKKDISTIDAVSKIAKQFNFPARRIGYAGVKDKIAVTEQYISIEHPNIQACERFNHEGITLSYLGSADHPLSLGELDGNEFTITVRNLVDEEIDLLDKRRMNLESVPNYYDDQRFSKKNVDIGIHMLKREFKKAATLIDDSGVAQFLLANSTDYIGAIRTLPKRHLLLYIHAVQSKLFNILTAKSVKDGRVVSYSQGQLIFPNGVMKQQYLPLVGFGTECEDEKVEKILNDELRLLGISKRDFIIREIPNLSSEGVMRKAVMEINNFSIRSVNEDSFNKNRKSVTITFMLPKGSYATILVKYLF